MFSKISKIRKQKLDKIESEVIKLKQEIRGLKKKLDKVYEEIKSLKTPVSGDMILFSSYNEQKRLLGNQKDDLLRILHVKEMQLAKKHQEYKKANIEYEKIKYLEEVEFKKKMDRIKKLEQKDLDEVANMLYKRGK